MVRYRVNSTKFLTHRVSAVCTGDFAKKRFLTILGGHLECNEKPEVIDTNYFLWYGGAVVYKKIYLALYIPLYRSNMALGGQ